MSKKNKFSRRDFLKNSVFAGTSIVVGSKVLSSHNIVEAATSGTVPLAQSSTTGPNPIVIENAKPGTTDWQLFNPSGSGEIEGYASLTSVARGGQISLFVSTTESSYTLEIFRLGWYGGAGARRMTDPITRAGVKQPMPTPDPVTGLVECNWTNPYVLTIPNNPADPTDWLSGVYLAKLTSSATRNQAYIIFVVRDDARASDLLFQSSVTTYQAYNNWGGKSLYDFYSPGGPTFAVSFNRPYNDGLGTGQFLAGWSGWEYNKVRFLEREGYDVSYCTNLDTHENPNLLLNHKGFLSVGHDEYWSWQMRQNVEAARDRGISLGFFSANTCYWQVRFEPSKVNGAANRTMVSYKESYTQDPFFTDSDANNNYLVTGRWRDNTAKAPEDSLLGVMYDYSPVNGDIVIEDASHWACANTGLKNSDKLVGLLGYEADRLFPTAPSGIQRIGHSPVDGGFSDMTVYTAASGATVFATGTIQWAWGLDDYRSSQEHPVLVNPAAQQITRNVLQRFIGAQADPPPPPPPVGNLIVVENAKPGTNAFVLANPATNREIEGYASLTSVPRGGQISFFVNTADPSYTIEIFRMGWYGGAGSRQVMAPVQRPGVKQPMPTADPATGLVECNWTNPYTLTIPNNANDPTDWMSGVYLAKLTASTSGKQSYIPFVVRDDARASDLIFQSSVTTWQAYNNWGGQSLYSHNSVNGVAAYRISFNRPYAFGMQPTAASGVGAGEFLTNVQPDYETEAAGWEYNMVRFLEREGYDVVYSTDVDNHENPNLILSHKAFLSVGHDEYWTWQMRQNVEAARDRGIHLGFFTANACYWQIRLEPSVVNGAKSRTITCYKLDFTKDPFYSATDPTNNYLVSTQWRMSLLNRPEDALIGISYDHDPVDADMLIEDASHWVCAGTGLKNGDRIPRITGYEVDTMHPEVAPPGIQRIAHTFYTSRWGADGYADMTVYTAASGAIVFATGTMGWNWALDDYNVPTVRVSRLNAAVQQMTRNVLQRFVGSSSGSKTVTATQLTSSQNPSASNQSVTFTATVISNGGTPSGVVEFFDGATSLGKVNLNNGSASFTTSVLSAGTHTITATYSGDTKFNGSASPALTQTVNTVKAATSTSIATSANPSNTGQAVTFTAQVTGSGGTSSGTVEFFDGTTSLGTASLSNGRATLTTSALSADSHSMTAVYSGDANFEASTSPALTQTVNVAQATTSTSLTSSLNPSRWGQSVTFIARVTSSNGAIPSGTVTFKDGTTTLATKTLNINGRASFSTATLSVTTHSITAVYNGNATLEGSTSPVLLQKVTRS